MNLSSISSKKLIGKLLRLPLKLIPPGKIMPILQGTLRGKRWVVGSSNHGCWLGSYEYNKQKEFVKCVGEGDVVFDVGAHAGYYTLLASTLVGRNGKVFAFEPSLSNIHNLRRHLTLNRISNAEIIDGAVTEKNGWVYFRDNGTASSTGAVTQDGGIKIKSISLDSFCRERGCEPNLIKMDIEGGEQNALLGAKTILQETLPVIFLATHSIELHENCCQFLRSLGYHLKPIGEKPLETTDEILAIHPLRLKEFAAKE